MVPSRAHGWGVRPPCTPTRVVVGVQGDWYSKCLYKDMKNINQPTDKRRPDGRVVALEAERRTLRALHRFGWLRTRDIAALVHTKWAPRPAAEPGLSAVVATESALRMAQRTLRRMRESRLVLFAQGPDGSTLYALAEPGVRVLRALGIDASTGKDSMRGISGGYYRHRCVANEIAIAGIVQGLRVATEREIAQGLWVGGEAGIAGKRPDVLWRNREAWDWIEVQRSRPNAKDYARLLSWLRHMLALHARPGAQIADGARLRKIVFVCNTAFGARLLRDLRDKRVDESALVGLLSFSHSLYKLDPIKFC